MTTGPLNLSDLAAAAVIDEALELVARLQTEPDPDLIADVLEHIAGKADLAHAVLGILVVRLRNPSVELVTAVELVAQRHQPTGALILPPGAHL